MRISCAVHEYSWEIHDIHVPNHTEIMRNALRHSTCLYTTIARATHALTGVTNIEFSVLHVALSNASTTQGR